MVVVKAAEKFWAVVVLSLCSLQQLVGRREPHSKLLAICYVVLLSNNGQITLPGYHTVLSGGIHNC